MIERPDCSLADMGLTVAEGRSLLAKVQAELVSMQVEGWLSGQNHCQRCGEALSHKDHRSTIVRTVYGKVTVKSPRLWSCACQRTVRTPRCVVHPLSKALTNRTTPELKYLQAKWASHFLSRNGVAADERVTVISEDAGEFEKTVQGSRLARGRILDWFRSSRAAAEVTSRCT